MARELKHFVVSDYAGNVQEGATCYLYLPNTNTEVTGLLDKDGNPLAQPFLSLAGGVIEFQAPNGTYDLVTQTPTLTTRLVVNSISAESFLELEHRVNVLLFQDPAIVSLLIDSATSKIVERGSTVAGVTLNWTLTGNSPTSQSINQGVGSIAPGTLSRVINGPFSADQTWTLTVSATNPNNELKSDSENVSLYFRQKRYWGVSASESISNANILAFENEFATTKNKTISYNASGGRYPYYCYPASFGVPTNVTVGGFSFSDYTVQNRSFTNSSGYVENYIVIKFNTMQTGSNIVVSFS